MVESFFIYKKKRMQNYNKKKRLNTNCIEKTTRMAEKNEKIYWKNNIRNRKFEKKRLR